MQRVAAKGSELEVDFRFATDQFRDEHLADLALLENITILRLKRTPITDAGLAQLASLEQLEVLSLRHQNH